VAPAILTAVSTTVISFLPVFAMEGAEGKLFKPLAYTKTFALVASLSLAILVVPVLASFFFRREKLSKYSKNGMLGLLLFGGLWAAFQGFPMAGLAVVILALLQLFRSRLKNFPQIRVTKQSYWILVAVGIIILAHYWNPLGYEYGTLLNLVFTGAVVGSILFGVSMFTHRYTRMLTWMLTHRRTALSMPLVILLFGTAAWIGTEKMMSLFPQAVKDTRPIQRMNHIFPGLGKEFMPPLDEGAFLYMPTTMPHAGIEESLEVLSTLDKAIYSIPEVEEVVGKIGRADTPLDPAPLSMIESIISYLPEYKQDQAGNLLRFQVDDSGEFVRSATGELLEDPAGEPFRQWRPHIRSNQDIWDEIVAVAQLPGTTSAPKLQPIAARVVMLQSGMRAPMGIRIRGADSESMEHFGLELERHLKTIPGIKANAVFADRIVGKPYLEIDIQRDKIARYGLSIEDVHAVISVAVGGKQVTSTFEGRERYPVRVRYMRDYRQDAESLESVLIPIAGGAHIPLGQLATIRFTKGPQVIKSEDTFLLSYVLFDRETGLAEVDAVERAQKHLRYLIDKGELIVPAGVSYDFTGSYENQIRATQRLRIILPLALILIFGILYLQFKRVSTTLMVFSSVFVAWAGGFILLWLYGQGWFMHVSVGQFQLQEIFQIGPKNLSVAVWVGFLALFGIATDDGVLISTYLDQQFKKAKPKNLAEIRKAAIAAGSKRIRPAMITTATTILALLPILTSTGRGSDVMVPMAIPSFGGMFFVTLNTLVVPVLYAWAAEKRLLKSDHSTP
jgi:Cu(I)/Ag(I) efflux system membrane protein CusA/SilA